MLRHTFLTSRFLIFSLLLTFLVACGESDDHKQQEATQTLALTGQAPSTINENEFFSFTVQLPEGFTENTLFQIENKPTWTTFDEQSGVLSGTPNFEQAGIYTDIKISAVDNNISAELPAFTITVNNIYPLPGTVIDGYIEGALVYLDENLNFKHDTAEIFALSNSQGEFLLEVPESIAADLYKTPIRAYLGRGAKDIARPELDFSKVPVTFSLAPINILSNDWASNSQLILSPYSNELALQVESLISKLHAEEISASLFQKEITSVENGLLAGITEEAKLGDAGLNNTAAELKSIIFGDFVKYKSELPELIQLAEQKTDQLIEQAKLGDLDNDGIINQLDEDDDNDGVKDENDHYPFDPSESSDYDGDHIGDNKDPDDDNDGVEDTNDAFPLNSKESRDNDQDGLGDNEDLDDDNDGVKDENDHYPFDSSESSDYDGDHIGDNKDLDDDNDGVEDTHDAFPLNSKESRDNDQDGLGDNEDLDDDNDGIKDIDDLYPFSPLESADSDLDGIGDNTDAFPTDLAASIDSDKDGYPDNWNEGKSKIDSSTNLHLDAFPNDLSASIDTDDDGYPDNWNEGKSAQDSTTNLQLDIFPQDENCWLAEHGNSCDFIAKASGVQDDNIILVDDIIYILNTEFNRIYRWSTTSEAYLSPILVGDKALNSSPSQLTYSAKQERFYLGYENGQVNYITASNHVEQSFRTLNKPLLALFGFDSYLRVVTPDVTYLYNNFGLVDERNIVYQPNGEFSFYYAWDSLKKHLYSLVIEKRYSKTYSALNLKRITPNAGYGSGGSDRDERKSYYPPIRIYPDVSDLNQHEHTVYQAGKVDNDPSFKDSVFHENIIISLKTLDSGSEVGYWKREVDDKEAFWKSYSYSLLSSEIIAGEGIKLFVQGDDVIAVNKQSNKVHFHRTLANEDGDNIPAWWERFYQLDPFEHSDLLDTDKDGLTDYDEYQNNANPNKVDGDNDGISDLDEVSVHFSNPNNSDSDFDSIPDKWELDNGLDMLNQNDSKFDQDGDGFSNLDEFILNTDPSDEASIPTGIITNQGYSFEDNNFPESWKFETNPKLSDSYASDGSYSLFIEDWFDEFTFSEYFVGNTLTLDVRGPCSSPFNKFSIEIDGSSKNYIYGRNWSTITVSIPRGYHKITIESISCDLYIDNMQFKPLPSLLALQAVALYSDISNITAYNRDMSQVFKISAPWHHNVIDVLLTERADIAALTLDEDSVPENKPSILVYNRNHLSWQEYQHESWNASVADGFEQVGDYFFAINKTENDVGAGLIRFDILNDKSEIFVNHSFYGLATNQTNYLYAAGRTTINEVNSTVIKVYNIDSMEELYSFNIDSSYDFTVDHNGRIFALSNTGIISEYDLTGAVLNSFDLSQSPSWKGSLNTIQFDDTNQLVVTTTDAELITVSDDLSTAHLNSDFVSLVSRYYQEYFDFIPFKDVDGDGMAKWWETYYQLSDDNAADALDDLDGEGLTNVEEYQLKTDPLQGDTDQDTLDDYSEVKQYLTDPLLTDTDDDGLSDQDELNNHHTNPLLKDSDNDGFSDYHEITHYLTEPNETTSVPTALSTFMYDFDDGKVPDVFFTPAASSAAWYVDLSGNFRSGAIIEDQSSSVSKVIYVVDGVLRFDVWMGASHDFDVYVDNVKSIHKYTDDRETIEIPLSAGEHTIKFSYTSGRLSRNDTPAAYIDNLSFTATAP